MRSLCFLVLLAIPFASLGQDSSKPLQMKIEGEAPNHQAFIVKLNAEGASHDLKFALADLGFDYRVVLTTNQTAVDPARGGGKQDVASATVFDSKGRQLFKFEQNGTWRDAGAAAAGAKQIVKEFVKQGIAGAR
jgi:hypothetical protein